MLNFRRIFQSIAQTAGWSKPKTQPPLVISGFSSHNLAQDIADELGSKVMDVEHKIFKNKELRETLRGNVRGREVVVVASGSGDPNRMEKETRLLLRSARHNGAKLITLVLTNMFYGRSDDDFDERGTAALVDTIETLRPLCDNVIVADPHNHGLTKEMFRAGQNIKNCTTAHFAYPFAVQLKDLFDQGLISRENLLLTYPDAGASKRITNSFRDALYGTASIALDHTRKDEWAQAMANRDHDTGEKDVTVTTDVRGKDIVMFEDMIDSGGTACEIARILKEKGARRVVLFATTGLFTPDDRDNRASVVHRIDQSDLDAVFITDTFSYEKSHSEIYDAIEESPVIHVIKTGRVLGSIIEAMHMDVTTDTDENANSISHILRGKHAKQIDGNSLANPVVLHPDSPLFKLTA
ncbi:MAG: ribose-phosphate pyrophosphokinase [Alphaproteobacteria bacterium]|nr:ribose-phosphate pyrophosphokinase [Alphaproteobacteria bacterium]